MSTRKPQRPRLEVRDASRVWGGMDRGSCPDPVLPIYVGMSDPDLDASSARISLKDAKRLRKFLEKCEAYLEARKSEQRYDKYLKSKRGPRKTKLGQALIGAMKEAQKRGRV